MTSVGIVRRAGAWPRMRISRLPLAQLSHPVTPDEVFGSDNGQARQIARLFDAYRVFSSDSTHLSLDKDSPYYRQTQKFGRIAARPILDGLHHQSVRIQILDRHHRRRPLRAQLLSPAILNSRKRRRHMQTVGCLTFKRSVNSRIFSPFALPSTLRALFANPMSNGLRAQPRLQLRTIRIAHFPPSRAFAAMLLRSTNH